MNNYIDELKILDKELNRYKRKVEKLRFLTACKLIKRIRLVFLLQIKNYL